MSAIPVLKKKLKSIDATRKLSKALKTVSAVKFSHLSAVCKNFNAYSNEFSFLYGDKNSYPTDNNADCVIVMGSNRGFCGGFNTELLGFVREELGGVRPEYLVTVGERISALVTDSLYVPDYKFRFSDVPLMAECEPLFELITSLAKDNKNYRVKIIYPKYKNTMTQTPVSETLVFNREAEYLENGDTVWVPDRETVFRQALSKGFRALLFGKILETALGAQAATLMTMRSAFDTASEYSAALRSEMHRIRQSEVTADVIETTATRTGDENDA